MEKISENQVVTREGFQAIGLKWEGTYEQAGAGKIKVIHEKMKKRVQEIPHTINPDILLAVSYHATPDAKGFTHYAAIEVSKVDEIPEGMESISIPTLQYATCEHRRGQDVSQSYTNMYNWMAEKGLKPYSGEFTHLEVCLMDRDDFTRNPEFTIMIPLDQ